MSWKLVSKWRWEIALVACISVAAGILTVSEIGHARLTTGYDSAIQSMWAT